MTALAIIPARLNSSGIPNKNFRPLAGGKSPVQRAYAVAFALVPEVHIAISTEVEVVIQGDQHREHTTWVSRPVELAQDNTPMIDVVKHVLAQIPGPDDQPIVLLQPTQPLRTPEQVKRALELLRGGSHMGGDSVVSVVELPRTHSPDLVCEIFMGNRLMPWPVYDDHEARHEFSQQPTCRQDAKPAYMRDGTVYAFFRKTVSTYGNIYGETVRPLIIPAEDTCALDSEADWREAERRLRAREA